MFPKKIRIVSDGNKRGTRIYDAETGQELSRVTKVVFEHDAKDSPVASLTLTYRGEEVQTDLVAAADIVVEYASVPES